MSSTPLADQRVIDDHRNKISVRVTAQRLNCSTRWVHRARVRLGLVRSHHIAPDAVEYEPDDETPGCPRCGLRDEHDCLPPRAEHYLGRFESIHES